MGTEDISRHCFRQEAMLSGDFQWRDLRWKTWQAGLYDILVAACSNFLVAASFSSMLVCTKNLIHQVELLNLAYTRKNILACQVFKVKPSNQWFFSQKGRKWIAAVEVGAKQPRNKNQCSQMR